jgi:hypothetical protein
MAGIGGTNDWGALGCTEATGQVSPVILVSPADSRAGCHQKAPRIMPPGSHPQKHHGGGRENRSAGRNDTVHDAPGSLHASKS